MTKFLLAAALVACSLQAQDTVHYDVKDVKKPAMTKPNHPTADLYTKR